MDDIAKFLDEDEDETAHSAVEMEAYAAGLGRVLKQDTSTSQQLCDRNAAALFQGSSVTSSDAGNATSQCEQDIVPVRDNSSIIASPHMTNSSQQPDTTSESKNTVPVARLVSIIQPQLDQDRALRFQTLCRNLKKREIPSDVFFQRVRSLVGDQMLRTALLNLQGEAATNSQIAALNQVQSAQLPTDVSISDNDAAKSREVEREADLHGTQVGQICMNPNIATLQNQAQRPSSTSEKQKTAVSPSMTHSSTRLHPLTATIDTQNKSMAGQKKPMKASGSLPPSSKKQKVSESLADQFQSIEHLNDVTAISGINLREEEEQLFSGSKKDRWVSEAARQVEEKLILQKIPLQKKMIEIMAKSGLKNMTSWQWPSLERCLSLALEERMHRILSTAIRFSKQRVDMEKTGHKITVTSDVQKEVMAINCKAHEEWEKKQAENEKSQKLKLNSKESKDSDADKKYNKRGKSTEVNIVEVNNMRAKAANVAAGAATGINDVTSRWKLMIESKQKEGGSHTSSGTYTKRDVGQKLLASSTNSGVGQKPLASSTTSTRDQVIIPPQVARTISVKDVLGVLEREPQMSKSTLLYRLYLS